MLRGNTKGVLLVKGFNASYGSGRGGGTGTTPGAGLKGNGSSVDMRLFNCGSASISSYLTGSKVGPLGIRGDSSCLSALFSRGCGGRDPVA